MTQTQAHPPPGKGRPYASAVRRLWSWEGPITHVGICASLSVRIEAVASGGPPNMGGAWTSKDATAVGRRTRLNPGHELKWFETKQGKASNLCISLRIVVNKLGDGGKDARMLSTNRKCTVESIVSAT